MHAFLYLNFNTDVYFLNRQVLRLRKKHGALLGETFVKTKPKSHKAKFDDLGNDLKEHVHGPIYDFIMSQIKSFMRKPRRHHWTDKGKALALSLLHSSPKTYCLLRKTFKLPSVKTLGKVMRNIAIYPGLNDSTLEALRKKFANANENQRLVTLAFDKMTIKKGVS